MTGLSPQCSKPDPWLVAADQFKPRGHDDNPLIIKPIRGHELVHDPVVGRPAHPAGFRWIGVVSRIASQSPAEFTRPTKRPVMNGLSLRGVGQAVGAAGPYAREPSKLPVVLSADEVVRFLEAIPSLKSRAALTTVYAAGLRVSEVVLLKIADIDSQRMVIRVEQGKGGKDRYVMISPQLLRILRTYWRLARPKRWLFPGRDEERPLVPNVLHAACRSACAAAGLSKQVTVHTLRHTFATH